MQPVESTAPRPTPGRVDRRLFLTMAGAALVATWSPEPGWSTAARPLAPPEGPALMPGYLRGSRALVMDPEARRVLFRSGVPYLEGVAAAVDGPLELVPADTLDMVPPLEGQAAVVEVLGLLPPDHVRSDLAIESVDLEVAFATREQPSPPYFLAWTYDRRPVEQLAGPTRFTVPLGDDVTLRLAMRLDRDRPSFDGDSRDLDRGDRETGADRRPAVFVAEMPVVDTWNAPRLRAGLYALPLSRPSQRAVPGPVNREWLVPLDLQFLAFIVRPAGE